MANRPSSSPARPVSPLQAARKRLGLRQNDVAEMIGVPLSSYIPWDQGRRRPQDPRVSQAIAEALQTPGDILWPPEGNPVIGPKLAALRQQQEAERQAAERLLARDDQAQAAYEASFRPSEPKRTPDAAPESLPDPPLHRQIEATLARDTRIGSNRARRRRVLIPAAASIAVVAAAGTAIATTGGDGTPTKTAPVVQAGPTAAQRERSAQQAALAAARERGDYDTAITVATRLQDTATAAQLRNTAGELVARRARQAAERGDLPLATSRLDRAEDRYGDSPAIRAVRNRIDAIKDARKKRAANRARVAKKRAAARARAAAAARQRAPSQPTAPPSSSGSPSPSSPAPSSPSPSPSPAPSTGGSGGSSGGSGGGSSSSKGNDPGIY